MIHAAIVTSLHHERSHENVAFEIFYPQGPFAILPLNDDEQGHRSAIVWTVKGGDAAGMMKLSERGLLAPGGGQKMMGGFLGRLGPLGPRSSYPLGVHHAGDDHRRAARFGRRTPRTASIRSPARASMSASATSRLWSRCWSRANASASTSRDAQLLARYDRWRSLDTLMVSIATDGF